MESGPHLNTGHLNTGEHARNPETPDWRGASRPPVVLQVLPELVTGGAERGCIDVALALAAAGAVPLVASQGGPMVRELDRAGITHLTLPLKSKNPWRMHRNARALERIVRERGVDILHARSRAPAWSAWLASRATGARFMTTFHAPYNFSNGLKRRYNSVMARGERVIAISEFIRDHILSSYDIDPARIRVIHRGIDGAVFAPDRVGPARIAQLANRWRLDDGRPVVLLPGRLTRWKGQEVMVEALARLGRRDLICLLVGSDQGRTGYRQALEAMITAKGLGGVVRITDHCDDMAAAYLLSTVVVSASREPEAFGRVIAEAQAMGRPVIVTSTGAYRETVLEGETAWVVPPDDPNSLAAAVEQALTLTDARRAGMGRRAIEFVNGRFTRERMCADTLGVYAELLAE